MPAFFGLSLGLLLTATAGWVDAIGFLRLGGLYPSFMSGNTTQLGVALSHDDWHLVEMAATILGLFFVGGFCGGLAAALPSSWRLPAVLTLETALLPARYASPSATVANMGPFCCSRSRWAFRTPPVRRCGQSGQR